MVLSTPCQVHPTGQLLGKDLGGIKEDLTPHHSISRQGRLMYQSSVSGHEVDLGRLLPVRNPVLLFVPAKKLRGFNKNPGQVFFDVFLISFSFGCDVTCLLIRHHPAGGVIFNLANPF